MRIKLGAKNITSIFVTLGSISAIFVTPLLNRAVEDWYGYGRHKEKSKVIVEKVEKKGQEAIIKTPDPKSMKIHEIYKRIRKWSRDLGCELEFSIYSVEGIYLELNIVKLIANTDNEIFSPYEKLNGKSKFERFADQLESKDPLIYEYVTETLENRCLEEEIVTLHWRDLIRTDNIDPKYKDMKLVWLDEESLNVKRIPD